MIVFQFERYPDPCRRTTHQRGRTRERSTSYISGLLWQELWWLFIKSAQQEEACRKTESPTAPTDVGQWGSQLGCFWDPLKGLGCRASQQHLHESRFQLPGATSLLTFTKAFVIALPTNTARPRLALELAGLVCINQLIEREDFK